MLFHLDPFYNRILFLLQCLRSSAVPIPASPPRHSLGTLLEIRGYQGGHYKMPYQNVTPEVSPPRYSHGTLLEMEGYQGGLNEIQREDDLPRELSLPRYSHNTLLEMEGYQGDQYNTPPQDFSRQLTFSPQYNHEGQDVHEDGGDAPRRQLNRKKSWTKKMVEKMPWSSKKGKSPTRLDDSLTEDAAAAGKEEQQHISKKEKKKSKGKGKKLEAFEEQHNLTQSILAGRRLPKNGRMANDRTAQLYYQQLQQHALRDPISAQQSLYFYESSKESGGRGMGNWIDSNGASDSDASEDYYDAVPGSSRFS